MPVIYGIRELRYFLVEGDADWMENFRILDSQQRPWNGRNITFYALCTSHAVTVRGPAGQFTELLSCRGGLHISPTLAEMASGNSVEMVINIQGLRYRFRMHQHALRGNDILLGQFEPQDEITIAYPKMPDLETPMTRIGWRFDRDVFSVETLHTYPEEGKGIRSESHFEIV